jgi:hypothetical protein
MEMNPFQYLSDVHLPEMSVPGFATLGCDILQH